MAGSQTADTERTELDLLIRGFQVSQMIRVIADLGLADRIPSEGQTAAADLATQCGVLHRPLLRMLRALASLHIFAVTPDEVVRHTERSRLLRTDTPNTMHHGARFWAGPGSWRAWGMLDRALKGEVPHEAAWSTDRFTYLRSHAEEARVFDDMMANFPDNRHAAVADTYDFSDARLIADVGGGNGAALRHILARFPKAQGIVFDREDVVSPLGSTDLMDGRIKPIGGSFFEAVPPAADLYILSRVLHDWSDEDCLRILRVCRTHMQPGSRLLIVEHIMEPDPTRGRPTDYLVDLQMMAMFGSARARTEDEFKALLAETGFALRRHIATGSPVSILVSEVV
jgi:SAM-dependent methyltransferase